MEKRKTWVENEDVDTPANRLTGVFDPPKCLLLLAHSSLQLSFSINSSMAIHHKVISTNKPVQEDVVLTYNSNDFSVQIDMFAIQ